MADASASGSLATMAKQLTALSRAKSDNEKTTQDEGQVETALRKLNAELGELGTVLVAHRKLNQVGVPVEPYPDLDKPAKRLRTQVEEVGRPTAQYLTARSRDVINARTAIADSDRQAWRLWAGQQIQQLPLGLKPRLALPERGKVDAKVAEMQKAALSSQPRSSDVTLFVSALDAVKEFLASVEETNVDVLAKFDNGRVLLADLSDDELHALRDDNSLATQLYLVIS